MQHKSVAHQARAGCRDYTLKVTNVETESDCTLKIAGAQMKNEIKKKAPLLLNRSEEEPPCAQGKYPPNNKPHIWEVLGREPGRV